jgi:hypothetical protein
MGHDYIHSSRGPVTRTADSKGLLSISGSNNTLTARLARTVLNHAPIGEYRARFFPHENIQCPHCHVTQTRRHIISTCPLYTRRPMPNFYEFILNSAEPIPLLVEFLTQNPTAFTFDDAPPDLAHFY